MYFANPFFLFGLFLIIVPIIIHLFNFRRYKKEYFSNVELIQEVINKTKRQSQLKHILVLISRILAILFLVIAFAKPLLNSNKKIFNDGKSIVSVYIDNSFSMEANNDNKRLFDIAISKARDIASAYKYNDNFYLITNDFEGKHQRLLSKEEYINQLNELVVSPSTKSLDDVLRKNNDFVKSFQANNKFLYLISDFQNKGTLIQPNSIDTLINYLLIPVETQIYNNLYIDSAWFDKPVQIIDKNAELNVLIKNSSDIDCEKVPVKLSVNNQQLAISSLDLPANSEKILKLSFSNNGKGLQSAVVEIADFPIIFDDKLYLSFNNKSNIKILDIFEKSPNAYISLVYKLDSTFIYSSMFSKQIDYASFSSYDLIILDELDSISSGLSKYLSDFCKNGGSILVVPSKKMNLNNLNNFFAQTQCDLFSNIDTVMLKASEIVYDNPFFDGVFEKKPNNIELPSVLKHYKQLRSQVSQSESLIKLSNGDDFLNVCRVGSGSIYTLSVAIQDNFTDFMKQSIFVPVLYKMAILSQINTSIYYPIDEDATVEIRNKILDKEEIFKVKSISEQSEFIPEFKKSDGRMFVRFNNNIKNAGNYLIFNNKDSIMPISFNYNRSESVFKKIDWKLISDFIKNNKINNLNILSPQIPLNDIIINLHQGKPIWKYFLVLALIFLGFEVLLLRFLK